VREAETKQGEYKGGGLRTRRKPAWRMREVPACRRRPRWTVRRKEVPMLKT
jgi:hypothetical protein